MAFAWKSLALVWQSQSHPWKRQPKLNEESGKYEGGLPWLDPRQPWNRNAPAKKKPPPPPASKVKNVISRLANFVRALPGNP
jgi:hypothetical protein